MRKKRNRGDQATIERPQSYRQAITHFLALLGRERTPMILTVLTNVLSTILFAMVPWITAVVIDDVVEVMSYQGGGDLWNRMQTVILWPILTILFIAVVNFALNYYQERQMARIGESVSLGLRERLSSKMTKLPLSFFDNTQVGEILSKATSDIDKISEVLITGFNQFVYSVLTIGIGIILLFVINTPMALMVVSILLLGSILTGYVSVLNQRLFHNSMSTLSSLSNATEEALAGNLVIKSFGREDRFIKKIDGLIDEQFEAGSRSQFVNFAIYPSIRFVNQCAFILAAFFGGHYAIQGVITIGLVQAFLQYVVQISEPISNAAYIYNSFQGALASIERIHAILQLDEDDNTVHARSLPSETQGGISFRNVSFGYGAAPLLMHDVTFEAKAHQTVAIVGPTGAGKTTLVNLLMRFYEVNAGTIAFDGIPTNTIPREELRKAFGMVLQDTWLFKGTVADNIAYGRADASKDEIIGAAKVAQCDSFIRKLPQGYQTVISSDDGILSQGEQQLLTIARAVLTNPKVMILDEATSSIDTKTEKDIQTAIAGVMKGRTSFVIAHRLSTIRNADLILVMDHGDIIEQGSHAELLARDSFYARLYRTQFS